MLPTDVTVYISRFLSLADAVEWRRCCRAAATWVPWHDWLDAGVRDRRPLHHTHLHLVLRLEASEYLRHVTDVYPESTIHLAGSTWFTRQCSEDYVVTFVRSIRRLWDVDAWFHVLLQSMTQNMWHVFEAVLDAYPRIGWSHPWFFGLLETGNLRAVDRFWAEMTPEHRCMCYGDFAAKWMYDCVLLSGLRAESTRDVLRWLRRHGMHSRSCSAMIQGRERRLFHEANHSSCHTMQLRKRHRSN